MVISNKNNISISVALMLVTDDYNYDPRPNSISATGLLQPLRPIALRKIHSKELVTEIDVADLVASSTGTAVHDRLESSWINKNKLKRGLRKLGYGKAKLPLVNPTEEELLENNNKVPVVWVEQQSEMPIEINGEEFIVTGKFDIVLEGKLEDLKNTIAFKATKALGEIDKFENIVENVDLTDISNMLRLQETCPTIFDYAFQGSVYKMLNPDKITADFMTIQFILKDWKAWETHREFYPPSNVLGLDMTLFSTEAVKTFIKYKINRLMGIIESGSLPLCTDIELWRKPPQFKLYKDPSSKRALPKCTFENQALAEETMVTKRAKMPQIEMRVIASEPKRCNYCNVTSVCEQYKKFVEDGLITNKE